jgi:hypothetical protein
MVELYIISEFEQVYVFDLYTMKSRIELAIHFFFQTKES